MTDDSDEQVSVEESYFLNDEKASPSMNEKDLKSRYASLNAQSVCCMTCMSHLLVLQHPFFVP